MLKKEFVKESKNNLQKLITMLYELEAMSDKIDKNLKTSFEHQISKLRILKNELLSNLNQLENGNKKEFEIAKIAFNECAELFQETAKRITLLLDMNSSSSDKNEISNA